ncbi:hypothetical protein AUC43_16445 [Hymenobacter sedentarius]|uniref:Rad50/SbcC-type AAA domain-containing protein n=1 Tax=Hymenobacter sedentarius TaxID=1411621 RepID=A0A0U3SK70_9BACT|nr:AAA family ATPase [Hymenobacter sedentarius]ALW86532.1 hypothetical protein AUC43_16445 [Hymenobacter sedentarius]
MKILRVRFFNLNSLRGEHEVDFGNSPLSDAGLFAITGPTGAGKTTILDAITLALYGQVPRHDGSGPEQVMSHGTGESWAEVEFQASGGVYRAKWGQHRARRRADGPLQDSKMELSEQKIVDGEETWPFLETYKSRVPGKVAELSGLEYRQFLRSVLLAQGEFTKFLKSTAGERAQLLEKLTDTRKYSDISRAAYERAKQETQRVETLRAGLAGVALLSPEEVTELEADVQELAQHVQHATAEQQRLTEAQTWRRRLEELGLQQQRSQSRLHQLTAQAETLTPVRQRVARHEQALPFQTPWALLQKTDEQLRHLTREAEQLRQHLPQLQAQVATARQARTAAAEARETAAATRRDQEPRLREAEKLDLQVQEADKRLREHRQEYEVKNERCKQLKATTEAASTRLRELRQQLHAVQEWLTKNLHLTELGEALPALTGSLQDWDHLRAELGRLLQAERTLQLRLTAAITAGTQGRAEATTATEQLSAVREQQQTATAQRDQWLKRLQHHETTLRQQHADQERAQNDLRRLIQAHHLILTHEEAREHLTAGEPCPLCGATEHPYAAGELGVNAESVRADREREEELGQRVRALNARLNRVQALTGMLENNGGLVQSGPGTPAPLSEAEEADAFAQVRALGPQLRELEQQRQALELVLSKAESRVQQATDQHRELTNEMTQVSADLADAREREPLVREQLASLSSSFGLTFSGENGPELIDRLKGLGIEFQNKQKAQTEAEKELAAAEVGLAKDEQDKAEVDAWLRTRKTELLAEHEAIKTQKEQRHLLFAGPDVAVAREQLEAAAQRADKQLTEADQQLQKHETDLTTAENQLRQREQDAARQQLERATQHAALVASLETAGLVPDPSALAPLLLPDAEVRRLAGQLQQHEQDLAITQQNLTDLAGQLHSEQARALTPDPAETIASQLQANREQLAAIHQQLGQRQERLSSHRTGLERHAAMAAELEKQQQEARRWRGLAEVIGSADGKKFSEFAQGLTLARLVDLANRHLTRLTDRYHILRNPEEHLDLLILDEYQAGSTRSMNSLSGGESFLVSLALALGLSELAGRKTQIDTLFIDEGFGTLDPDALDVALTALEMLQGTGKTIGIISHVEALKERVSTQINVRKGAGGISSIRVVGL